MTTCSHSLRLPKDRALQVHLMARAVVLQQDSATMTRRTVRKVEEALEDRQQGLQSLSDLAQRAVFEITENCFPMCVFNHVPTNCKEITHESRD